MPRIKRINVGGYIYHVLNRANARVQIFDNKEDYKLFENILEEAIKKFNVKILAYCIMPNHWHMVLYPENEGDLSMFMGWLTNTHTRRWHTKKGTVGQGHLYQGRYKSFICQDDNHFLTLVKYVEQNAMKANLVKKAEDWEWSSVWRRENGTIKQKEILSAWPVFRPKDYLSWLNTILPQEKGEIIEKSIIKSIPFGEDVWVNNTVKKFGLEQTLRKVGRPKNGG
ncbi:MAG: transposase [Candidatus Paceibacterota bacterium]